MSMKKLLSGVGAIIGYVFGLIGTVVTILTVSGKITIGVRWIIIIGMIVIAAIILAVKATIAYSYIAKNGNRFAITTYSSDDGVDYYYTDYSQYLRIGTLVTIYCSRPMSKIVGYGLVYNSSPDEYIEVKIVHIEPGMEAVFNQSKTNNNKVLRDLYILPNVYADNIPTIADFLKQGVS